MSYYVYIIKSETDQSWYYGFSEDLEKRLNFHNEGKSTYTKSKRPWKLIFCRRFDLKAKALKFERYLKKTRNKEYIKRVYSEYFI
jgi:putative endonuclease